MWVSLGIPTHLQPPIAGISGPQADPLSFVVAWDEAPTDLTPPIQHLFANSEVRHGAQDLVVSLALPPPSPRFWGSEGTVVKAVS